MSRPKQLSFIAHDAFKPYLRTEHGGDLRQGRRKLARPFDPRRPIHLTLRSSRARGDWSLLVSRNERRIKHLVYETARRKGLKVYKYANSGNHLHLLVQAREHAAFKAFLRTLTGLIARAVTGARRGKPAGKFWDALAWTRVVNWGRDFKEVVEYILTNELEGAEVWHRSWDRPRRP